MLRLPTDALLTTDLALPNRRSGKVRDLYDVTLRDGSDALLIVATDRISAFDVVLANGLPGKGVVLTQISRFWFEFFADQCAHHLLSVDVGDVPGLTAAEQTLLEGRIMLCRRTEVIPIECIARGYLTGSGYKDYQATGRISGIELPVGLQNGDRLADPLFTPSTKAASGHDENIDFATAEALVGADTLLWLRQETLRLYASAASYALQRGIILADTKFEFGLLPGTASDAPAKAAQPILIDEIFTPDSSRFWPAEDWRPGAEQPSFDKQVIRDYLEAEVQAGRWNRSPPGPALPPPVIEQSRARYLEAYSRLVEP